MHTGLMVLARRLINRYRMACAAAISRRRLESSKCAVCFAGLNRAGKLVENCLRTLRHQNLPESCIDITICDMGSPREITDNLEALARMYRVRFIRLNVANPEWRKPWVMNVAMRHSAGDAGYIMASDMDMIYASNFIEWVLRCHLAFSGKAFVVGQDGELTSPQAIERCDVVNDYELIKRRAVNKRMLGMGPCQSFSRQWIESIRGYDERLRGWGSEDNDMLNRAKRSRLWRADITSRTSFVHQWHEPTFQKMDREGAQQKFNDDCRWNAAICEDKTLVRNPGAWGVLPPTAVIMDPR